jgi:hypothetical protein
MVKVFKLFVNSFKTFFKSTFYPVKTVSLQINQNNLKKITIISTIVLIGTIIAVAKGQILSAYLGKGYPYNTFLFIPKDAFNDFFNMYNLNVHLNPYFEKYSFNSNYYPFGNIIFYLFTFLHKWSAYFLYVILFSLMFFYFNTRYFLKSNFVDSARNILIMTFLTFPYLSILDRGNIEGLMFIFVALFYYFDHKKQNVLSSLFLSMAIAMKLYPAIFVLHLIAEKKYKNLLQVVFLTLLLSIASASMFQGGLLPNLKFVLSGFDIQTSMLLAPDHMQNGVSLFNVVKIIMYKLSLAGKIDMQLLLNLYFKVILVFSIILSVYVIFVEKVQWKRTTLLVFAILMFPHISGFYKLIFLFLPIYQFVNTDEIKKTDWAFSVLFALLLIPNNYIYLKGFTSDSSYPDISSLIVIGVTLMLMITTLIVYEKVVEHKSFKKGSVYAD